MGCCGSKRKRVKDSRDEQTSQSRSKSSTDRSRSANAPSSPGGCKVALKQSMHPKTSAPVDHPSAPSLASASSNPMKSSQATASDPVVQISTQQVPISQPSVEEAKVSVLPVTATPLEPVKVSTIPVPSTEALKEVSVLPVPSTPAPVEPTKVSTLPVPVTQAPMEQAKTSSLPVPSTQTPVEQAKAPTSALTSSQLPSLASQHPTSLLLPSPQSNAPPPPTSATVNKSASMSSLSPTARNSVPFTATPLRQHSSSQGRLPFSEAYKPISKPFPSSASTSINVVDSTQQKTSTTAGVPSNTEQHSDGSKLASGSASPATVSHDGPSSQTASAPPNSAPTLPTAGALPTPLNVRPALSSALPTGGSAPSRPIGGGLLPPPTTGGFGKFHFSGNQPPTPGAFPPPIPQPQIGSLPSRSTGSATSLASQKSQAKPGILPFGSGGGTLPTPTGALPQPRGALPIGGASGGTHSATLPQPVQVSATPLAVPKAGDASNQMQPTADKQNENHKSTN